MKKSLLFAFSLLVVLIALSTIAIWFMGCGSGGGDLPPVSTLPTPTITTTTSTTTTTAGGGTTTSSTTTTSTTTTTTTTSTTTTTVITFGATEEVDVSSNVLDMAMGSAHFIYVNGTDYKYATNSGGGWANSTIEAGVTSVSDTNKPSIFVDSNGHIHASYYLTPGQLDLKYATSDDGGTSWTVKPTVETEDYSGKYSAIAYDLPNNIIHIVYQYYDGAANHELRHVKSEDGGTIWTMSTIEASYGDYIPSLALDSNGEPRVAYINSSRVLRYAKYNGSSWTTYQVDAEALYSYCAIDVDSVDNAHIAYTSGTSPYPLKYASGETSSWTTHTLTNAVYLIADCSIAIDQNDSDSAHTFHWMAVVKNDNHLMYLTNRSGSWQTYEIYAGGADLTGTALGIGVDSSSKVHFGYQDGGQTGTIYYRKQN
ncbi:sialidase family protein [Candidatus Margulisiibacteriota bacterium]